MPIRCRSITAVVSPIHWPRNFVRCREMMVSVFEDASGLSADHCDQMKSTDIIQTTLAPS